MSNRVRSGIYQTVAVLSMNVKETNKNDWKKLMRMIKYLSGTKKITLL